jgi:hypothetical protein
MHGEHNVKFINAQQAKPVYHYRNIKEKLHKTKASIWFNKICKINTKIKKCIRWLKNWKLMSRCTEISAFKYFIEYRPELRAQNDRDTSWSLQLGTDSTL